MPSVASISALIADGMTAPALAVNGRSTQTIARTIVLANLPILYPVVRFTIVVD